MSYIDGFVIPVPPGKKEAYREMAAKAAPIFQRLQPTDGDPPFDMQRVIFGGFMPIVQNGSNP